MIELTVNKFITHKKRETLSDCQDAAEFNEDRARYAVADGATRSFFPKMWADSPRDEFLRRNRFVFRKTKLERMDKASPAKMVGTSNSSTVQETKRFISIDRLSRSESAAVLLLWDSKLTEPKQNGRQ